ncbi:hypothetical protein HCU64_14190 [Methylobacterium sp. C25]|uniref:hypothetical protein n=1 Tax=Methylobacterium sp. C25 TaxID=2721622 RepID=UPI001F467742|nr:hypothetical protein [Methylobacterium sp. C25]MCE4224909.1 hypothetical protein [Methylobacterium sp. C25]
MSSLSVLHWRRPPVIEACCPDDRGRTLKFGVSDDLTGNGRENWRRTPLFMVWAHLLGQLPPINNAAYAMRNGDEPTFSTLREASACFRGIKRPHHTEDDGCSVIVYVLKPRATLQYSLETAMVCPMAVVPVSETVVLTVQVRLAASLQEGVNGLDGIVTRIEPVIGKAPDHALPVGYDTRYAERCW